MACGSKSTDTSSTNTASTPKSGSSDASTPKTGATAPSTTSAPAPDIADEYVVKGSNPCGGDYTGSLTVKKRGDVYQFSWKFGSAVYDGVGVQTENAVAVAFSQGRDGRGCSVVQYKIGSDGSLTGRWGEWGQNSSGTENASRSDNSFGLDGSYVVNGTLLDGKGYKGTLEVATQGAGFLFDWNTGDASHGFGIRQGNFVSVGIGGGQCGFVAYEIKSDGTLDGQWSSFGAKTIGTEVATKK